MHDGAEATRPDEQRTTRAEGSERDLPLTELVAKIKGLAYEMSAQDVAAAIGERPSRASHATAKATASAFERAVDVLAVMASGAALSSAPRVDAHAPTDEHGWLIERKAHEYGRKSKPASWWMGGPSPMQDDDCWTIDSTVAIRFSRAVDASAALIAVLARDATSKAQRERLVERVTITEHLWPHVSGAEPVSAPRVAPTDEQIDRKILEVLAALGSHEAWDALTFESGPYSINRVRSWGTAFVRAALASPRVAYEWPFPTDAARSWSGFNVCGDKASIEEVGRLAHCESRMLALQAELLECRASPRVDAPISAPAGWLGYMDGTDFSTERGEPREGNKVYATEQQVLDAHKCTEECGVAKVRVTLVQWVKEPQRPALSARVEPPSPSD